MIDCVGFRIIRNYIISALTIFDCYRDRRGRPDVDDGYGVGSLSPNLSPRENLRHQHCSRMPLGLVSRDRRSAEGAV